MQKSMMKAGNTTKQQVNSNTMPPISIEIADGQGAFIAGEVIKGFVHLNLKQRLSAKGLLVGLYGEEKCKLKTLSGEDEDGLKEIINTQFPLSNFVDGYAEIGMFTFPFTMKVPQWVPASMKFFEGSTFFSIEYHIGVQFNMMNSFVPYPIPSEISKRKFTNLGSSSKM